MDEIVITTYTALWGLFLLGAGAGAALTMCLVVVAYKIGISEGQQRQTHKNLDEI